MILWSVIKSLASREIEVGVGLRAPSGCPFQLYRQPYTTRAPAALETRLWKPRHHYIKAVNVNSRVSFMIVTSLTQAARGKTQIKILNVWLLFDMDEVTLFVVGFHYH